MARKLIGGLRRVFVQFVEVMDVDHHRHVIAERVGYNKINAAEISGASLKSGAGPA